MNTQPMGAESLAAALTKDLYEIGVEIETYGDAAELVEKSARLSADSAKRLSMRKLGQRRALTDHTIARSLERITQRLGLPRNRAAPSAPAAMTPPAKEPSPGGWSR